MGLNLSNLETVLQNKVDGLTSSSTDKDVLLTSKSIEAATADITVAGIIAEGTTQTAAAATQATNAAASASTATTQAGIATTKAGEAATDGAAQVTLAAAQVALATTAKTNAETAKTASESAKASSETAETNALSSKNSAATSASTATTQAGISSTKAGEASTSASAAATSASGAASAATSAVNAVIDTAPANLNTLNELAEALGDDANYAATTTTALGNRYTKTETDSKIVALSPPATKAHVESLGIAASSITGALPAISGASLTGIDFVTKSATAPTSPAAGDLWMDTSSGVMKVYSGTAWDQMSNKFTASGGTITVSGAYKVHTFTSSGSFTVDSTGIVDVLIVGGGASGGGRHGGGGGGGGVMHITAASLNSGSYTVVIGAGGAGVTGTGVRGISGSNTTFITETALGGGAGGTYNAITGLTGGSGGGGGYSNVGAAGGASQPGPINHTGNGYSNVGGTTPSGFNSGGPGGGAGQYKRGLAYWLSHYLLAV